MSSTLMTEPAAGWYHDPADVGAWRWWDGSTWTDHVRPVEDAPTPAVSAVPDAPVTAPHTVEPAGVVIEPVPTHPPFFDNVSPIVPVPPAAEEPVIEPVAPSPEHVDITVIPQPGQVASGPAVVVPSAATGASASLTPPIPVTDQMYWHSSAAEVVEVPRHTPPTRSALSAQRTAKLPSYVRDWNDLGSPQTPGIWLLAFSPLLGIGVYVAVTNAMAMAGLPNIVVFLAGVLAAVLLNWVFAALDTRALAERGYHAPRLSWMLLLPPLAYLIARGRAVRRESKSAWAPELVYILSNLVVIGAIVLMFAAVIAMLGLTSQLGL